MKIQFRTVCFTSIWSSIVVLYTSSWCEKCAHGPMGIGSWCALDLSFFGKPNKGGDKHSQPATLRRACNRFSASRNAAAYALERYRKTLEDTSLARWIAFSRPLITAVSIWWEARTNRTRFGMMMVVVVLLHNRVDSFASSASPLLGQWPTPLPTPSKHIVCPVIKDHDDGVYEPHHYYDCFISIRCSRRFILREGYGVTFWGVLGCLSKRATNVGNVGTFLVVKK